MLRILMVCMGNICRSPMADGIMRHKIKLHGLDALVDSAGTISLHAGENPDTRATKCLLDKGIDIRNLVARPFTKQDFKNFDFIFVMDNENYRAIQNLADTVEEMQKVDFLMNLVKPGANTAVPDPYYGGNEGFENVYRMIDEATDILIEKIKKS